MGFLIFMLNMLAKMVIHDVWAYYRLHREGVLIQATITDLQNYRDDDSTSYYVYYHFTGQINGDPTRFEGKDGVSSLLYQSLEVGQKIGVRYLASDPATNVIQAEFAMPSSILPAILIAGVSILFILIGVVAVYQGVRTLLDVKRLEVEGCATQAIIFDRWEGKDSEGDLAYFVAYAFKPASAQGQPRVITQAHQNSALHKNYRIGDAITVRYLPDKPSVCQVQ